MSERANKRGAAQPEPDKAGIANRAKDKPRRKRTTTADQGDRAGAASAKGGGKSAKGKGKASKADAADPKRSASRRVDKGTGAKAGTVKRAANAAGKTRGKADAAVTRSAKATSKTGASSKKTPSGRKISGKASAGRKRAPRRTTGTKVRSNPVGEAANRKSGKVSRRDAGDDLFLERRSAPRPASDGTPPRQRSALFSVLNACLGIAIALLLAMGLRVHDRYGDFLAMREVVDKQTFYEGTTVEGVDVSKMTLSNAMDYWRNRVEARNAGRTVALDDGTTVTAAELGYTSDYESVLTTAWSHGRSGTLEERYRMAASRMQNPAAYAVHRTDYSEALVDQFVQMQALKIDQAPENATVADFNVDTYEFTFNPSRTGRQLDDDALKRDLVAALKAGGGNVTLTVAEQEPEITTDRIGEMYGLIDYAITNASSSSKSRLNNIKLAMSMINGAKLAPGETFSFNERVGRRTSDRGFKMATAYSGGEVTEQVGGGICQVSTTLFNAAVKADLQIDERHNHSLTVHYVDKGKDATVDWGHQDFKFTNTSPDDIYICCYLTDDKRVRFGIFGRLLPDGEKITLDAVTTRVTKFETEYLPDPSLAHGQMKVSQNGLDGYKAEAYKVRWYAAGNELSRELLCSSVYKSKNEIILYGA